MVEVKVIKELLAGGMSQKQAAVKLGVSEANISQALTRDRSNKYRILKRRSK